jgi:hypothetical protein
MAIEGYINFARSGQSDEQISQDGWVNTQPSDDVAINYNDVSDNQSNGVTLTFIDYVGHFPGTLGSELAGAGAASWAPVGSLRGGVAAPGGWFVTRHSGLDNAKTYTIKFAGSIDIPGRSISFSEDGRTTVLTLECYDSVAEAASNDAAVEFSGLSPASGIIDIEWSGGDGYLSAVGIKEDVPSPSATLDNGPVEPGKAMTGTYADYTSAPTVLTLTDSEDNAISSASEITDLVIDDDAETYAFTMPDRITTGTGTTLLRGDITVELT